MNYSKIKWTDVANGVGVRISLFVSGCRHGCVGCFNEEAWDFQAGEDFSSQVETELLQRLGATYIRGLSLLGGEPLDPRNQEEVLAVVKKAKALYQNKDLWCYSGYVYEDLVGGKIGKHMAELLPLIDILVDGRYEEAEKNLSLRFRGSGNQRIIDVKKTREAGKIQIWADLKEGE